MKLTIGPNRHSYYITYRPKRKDDLSNLLNTTYKPYYSVLYHPNLANYKSWCYNKPMDLLFDIIGWVGMVLILLAYLLLSFNKIKNGYTYQALNLLASLLMAIGLFPKNAWFSFSLQIIWALIAIITIIKLKQKPKTS